MKSLLHKRKYFCIHIKYFDNPISVKLQGYLNSSYGYLLNMIPVSTNSKITPDQAADTVHFHSRGPPRTETATGRRALTDTRGKVIGASARINGGGGPGEAARPLSPLSGHWRAVRGRRPSTPREKRERENTSCKGGGERSRNWARNRAA